MNFTRTFRRAAVTLVCFFALLAGQSSQAKCSVYLAWRAVKSWWVTPSERIYATALQAAFEASGSTVNTLELTQAAFWNSIVKSTTAMSDNKKVALLQGVAENKFIHWPDLIREGSSAEKLYSNLAPRGEWKIFVASVRERARLGLAALLPPASVTETVPELSLEEIVQKISMMEKISMLGMFTSPEASAEFHQRLDDLRRSRDEIESRQARLF